jgi:hypothetical protein
MSSCIFEELVARVAALLRAGTAQGDIDQLLAMLSPAHRAEVLASAHDLLDDSQPRSAGRAD